MSENEGIVSYGSKWQWFISRTGIGVYLSTHWRTLQLDDGLSHNFCARRTSLFICSLPFKASALCVGKMPGWPLHKLPIKRPNIPQSHSEAKQSLDWRKRWLPFLSPSCWCVWLPTTKTPLIMSLTVWLVRKLFSKHQQAIMLISLKIGIRYKRMFIALELQIFDKELIISTRDHFKEELVHKYEFP